MTCDNQTIAEMLVPYVEGALAEAERLEVTHLRPALPAGTRRAGCARIWPSVASSPPMPAASGPSPAVERSLPSASPWRPVGVRPPEPGAAPAGVRSCSQEVALLHGLHQDLEGRVAPGFASAAASRSREEVSRSFRSRGDFGSSPGGPGPASGRARQRSGHVSTGGPRWPPSERRCLTRIPVRVSGPSQDVAVKSVTSPSVQGLPSSLAGRSGVDAEPGQISRCPLLDREGRWRNQAESSRRPDLQARNLVEAGLSERAGRHFADPAQPPTPEVQPTPAPRSPRRRRLRPSPLLRPDPPSWWPRSRPPPLRSPGVPRLRPLPSGVPRLRLRPRPGPPRCRLQSMPTRRTLPLPGSWPWRGSAARSRHTARRGRPPTMPPR